MRQAHHLLSAALGRRVAVLLLVMLGACGDSGVVAPRFKADSSSANYTCDNAPIYPGPLFRLIYLPDGKTTDTTAVIANRYLVPHHSADTVHTLTNQGGGLDFIYTFGSDPTYCVTVFDSLNHHLPNVRGAIGP